LCTEPGCAKVPENEDEPYKGLVKPGTISSILCVVLIVIDIVFFGEALPSRFGSLVMQVRATAQ
jgi:NAD-dependent SIR2 family protein deacetylase